MAVPDLVVCLRDTAEETREAAAVALGQLGRHAESAAAAGALVEAVRDECRTVRRTAAVALGDLGAAAAAVLPQLSAVAADGGRGAREEAMHALGLLRCSAKAYYIYIYIYI